MENEMTNTPDNIHDLPLMYTTKQVSEMVGIVESTVRKYAQILEKRGYEFAKSEKGKRFFLDEDIRALERMKRTDKHIEKAAYDIALDQRRKRDMENGIKETIQNVSFTDIQALQEERSNDVALMQKQHNEMIKIFSKMASEFAASQERLRIMEENSNKMVSTMNELQEELKQERKEKERYQEMLNQTIEEQSNQMVSSASNIKEQIDKSVGQTSEKVDLNMKEIIEQLKKEREENAKLRESHDMLFNKLQEKWDEEDEQKKKKKGLRKWFGS